MGSSKGFSMGWSDHWIQIIQCSGKYQRWMSQLTHWMSRMWDDHQRNSLNIFTWGKLGKLRGKSNNSLSLWLSTIGWSNQHCMEFRWITTSQLLLNLEFFAFGCVWKRGITMHNPETAVGEHHDKPWKSGRIRRLSKWWVAGNIWPEYLILPPSAQQEIIINHKKSSKDNKNSPSHNA